MLLPFLLLSAALHATVVGVHEARCPLGGGRVKVYVNLGSNNEGGFDSDLATYSSEGQFREYAVATCADNLFSLYGSDMGIVLDEETAARLERALAEERARLDDPEEPEVWERYGIAARMYRELGRPPLFLAQLYVEASWTARDRAVGVYRGLEGPATAKALLDRGQEELARTDLEPEQRKRLLFNLARVAERAGWPELRDRYLDAFEAVGGLDEEERAALARFRRMVHEVEPRYQDLAIRELRAALARPDIAFDDKVRATYLLADLLRRRGHAEEALPLYALVMGEPRAPQELREMALVISRQLTGDDPLPRGP